jgi:hypothetical protein
MKYLIEGKQKLLKFIYMHLQLGGILTLTINVSKRFISFNFHRHIYTSVFDLAKRPSTSCSTPLGITLGPPHCQCFRITLR